MSVLTVRRLSKQLGERVLFEEVYFALAEGDRVGLVGANGSGKSTLMKMLANVALNPADPNGALYVSPHVRVAYLPQDFQPVEMQTVDNGLAFAQRELLERERQMGELAATMARLTSASRDTPGAAQQLEQAMACYGELATRFEQRGGYECTARTKAVLQGLGLSDIPRDRPMATLSGGEQVRLGLAAVLLQSPDLLLLDEPTNHLDLAALEWLEHYLAATPATILVASHDRLFLNRTVTRILEIDESDHHIRSFSGNYDAYLEEKQLQRRSWEKRFEEQQEQIRLLRQRVAEVNRQVGHPRPPKDNDKLTFKHHGAKVEATIGHKVKAAQVELNRVLAHPVPRPLQPMTFTPAFAPAKLHHTVAIAVTDLAYGIEGPDRQRRTLFSNVRFTLSQGECMLLVGPNGSGKTTLLDLLAGRRAPTEGSIFRPASTVIGYLQQRFVCADPQETLFDFFRSDLSGSRKTCEELLLSYQLFTFSEFRLPVCALSPGQQRKLMIAKLMASGANLLLLDEPTNHVSFPVVEAFERALASFPGAVVAVSHDRRFIERFGAPVWKLCHGRLMPTS